MVNVAENDVHPSCRCCFITDNDLLLRATDSSTKAFGAVFELQNLTIRRGQASCKDYSIGFFAAEHEVF